MAKQDELELEDGNEGKNNPNDDRRKQLYAQADEERENNEDFTDVQDEDFDKTTEIVEETAETKTKSESATVPQTRSFKVNGKTLELTEEQIAEYVQKGASANEKYEEAARLRREVDEKLKQLPVKTDAAQPQVTDDDLALARALQMGDEKEAAAVIARLRKPALQLDQVSRLVDERVSFQSSVDAFKEEFPDIAGDPYLWEIAQDKDAKLVAGGDTRPYFDRYKAIGEDLRNWLKAKAPNPTSDKQERKAAVAAPVKSGMRAQAPAEDDREESPSEIIAAMAKKRGQGYGG